MLWKRIESVIVSFPGHTNLLFDQGEPLQYNFDVFQSDVELQKQVH